MGEVRSMAIDIETFSDVDLLKCGVYAYSDSSNFAIMLFAYCFDDGETKIIDLANGEELPSGVVEALLDRNVIKTAFNANFERVCLSKHLGIKLSAKAWHCTAVQASMLALPLSLGGVGSVLGLSKQKMEEGKELIRYFCMPCKPTKTNQGRERNLPHHDMDKWERFKNYCIRDVDVEKQIREKLCKYPIPQQELLFYQLDQEINDRGVLVDKTLVEKAIICDLLHKEVVTNKAYEITGLENPNSVAQLKTWFAGHGLMIESLSKAVVADLMKEADGEVFEALRLRLLMAKTSVKKYEAIKRSLCTDGRVHGLLQFYGANRSGRWAGRLLQVQNLPKNHIADLEVARELVKKGCFEAIEILYDTTPGVLSELIRTALVPKQGCKFFVADFSAIEARVLAWLAGEKWRIDVFLTHGKIYEASASAMFGVPLEEIGKGSELRQKGKVSELACGYGGSVGALKAMGGVEMGLSEIDMSKLISDWRNANPHITAFWWAVDKAAVQAVKEKKKTKVGRITFYYTAGILFITLPSGRKLSYIKPRLAVNRYGKDALTYEGIGENKRWERIDTYGPKLVENIVQAASRDILAEAMIRLRDAGFDIVFHVHDEAVMEVPKGSASIEEVCDLMAIPPTWADGLPLRADGYICDFYKKD